MTRYFIFVKELNYQNKQRRFREITEGEYIAMGRNTETHWITVDVIAEVGATWLVSDSNVQVYIPKSQIIDSNVDIGAGKTVEIELPQWLAEQEGFC